MVFPVSSSGIVPLASEVRRNARTGDLSLHS
jgi:hypothetical protein